MESLKSIHAQLRDLKSQAKSLTEAGLTSKSLFTAERTRLNREDEASKIRAVYHATIEQLQRIEMIEVSASIGNSRANLILSLGGAALTALVAKGNRLLATANYLRQSPSGKQSFGLVMVCIGPRGLPDDVQAVSISELAHGSNRQEYVVIRELREQGFLLYNETDFSLLIDRVVSDIREGRLCLPVSIEKLSPPHVPGQCAKAIFKIKPN